MVILRLWDLHQKIAPNLCATLGGKCWILGSFELKLCPNLNLNDFVPHFRRKQKSSESRFEFLSDHRLTLTFIQFHGSHKLPRLVGFGLDLDLKCSNYNFDNPSRYIEFLSFAGLSPRKASIATLQVISCFRLKPNQCAIAGLKNHWTHSRANWVYPYHFLYLAPINYISK